MKRQRKKQLVVRRRRSGGSQDARDAANADHRGIIHCPPVYEEAMFVGTIVSGFLACVILVVGGVLSGRLAHRAEGVIGHTPSESSSAIAMQ